MKNAQENHPPTTQHLFLHTVEDQQESNLLLVES